MPAIVAPKSITTSEQVVGHADKMRRSARMHRTLPSLQPSDVKMAAPIRARTSGDSSCTAREMARRSWRAA